MFVQCEEPLIEQGADNLLYAVRAGDRVERLTVEIGQGEGGRLHGDFRRRIAFIFRVCPEIFRRIRRLYFPASGKQET